MWNRPYLKANAKHALANTYWRSFVVTLIASVFGIGGMRASFNIDGADFRSFVAGIGLTGNQFGRFAARGIFENPLLALISVVSVLIIGIFGIIFGCAILFFIKNPVNSGLKGYFVKNRKGQGDIGSLFMVFTNGRYLQSVKTLAFVSIKIFLWGLLFVIPGIVKSYSYRMVPYIVSQNPYVSSERAMYLSRQMTKGQKWKIFILDLSFLGWLFLGVLCLGIGTLFVLPYIEATGAELYEALKFRVTADNIAGAAEFAEEAPPQT